MVLDPVDSAAAGGLGQRAKEAGIPVVSYDRLILNADLDYYVAFDSVKVGEQQGEALSQKLAEDGSPEGPIVKINGDPQDNNAKFFNEGATSVFESEGVEIAQEYDTPDWLPENAQREMDQAITALGEDGFAAVYAANDGTAGGAIAALKAAGIDPATKPVTGQDAELAAIQRILAGEQYMTVYKPIKPLAENAAELAVALANGEDPPEGLINGEEDNGHGAGADGVHSTRSRCSQGQHRGHDHQRRLLERRRDLHRAVRAGVQGRGTAVGEDDPRGARRGTAMNETQSTAGGA